MSRPLMESQQPGKRPSETFSVDGGEAFWRSIYNACQDVPDPSSLQSSNQRGMSSGVVPEQTNISTGQASPHLNTSKAGSLLYPNWPQSSNQAGTSNRVVPNQTDVSTAQASPHPNTFQASPLKRKFNPERKREIDRAYRQRCKRNNEDMKLSLGILTEENVSVKKENESLKKDNTLMHQTLSDKAEEIDRLRNDLSRVKSEHEKQLVLVQTLTGLLADPVQLENKKLKDENASLRKNANFSSDTTLLAEKNAKLKIENKFLKVQNDALCEKIIRDNDKKREIKKEV